MKKFYNYTLLPFLLILSLSTALNAQAPSWQWITSGGGSDIGLSRGNAVATDAQGNVYVGGLHGGSIALQKFDMNGNLLWTAKPTNNNILNKINDVAVDASGNAYITGTFYNTCTFGSTTLVADPNSSTTAFAAFVAKIDAGGNFQWALNGSTTSHGHQITVDASGDIIAGGIRTTGYGFTMAGVTDSTNNTKKLYYIVKLTNAGNGLWAKAMECGLAAATVFPVMFGLTTDASGNIYGSGWLEMASTGALNFGGISLTGSGVNSVVFKINNQGVVQWAKNSNTSSSTKNCVAQGVGLDASGNVYIAGWLDVSTSFGSMNATFNDSYDQFPNLFIAKYSNNGDIQWVTTTGLTVIGDINIRLMGIGVNAAGEVFIASKHAGLYSNVSFGNGLVTSTSMTSGNRNYIFKTNNSGVGQWLKVNSGNMDFDEFMDMTLDQNGNAYVCGSWITGTGYDNLAAPASPSGVFAAKLNSGTASSVELYSNNQITVYPNPASDIVYLSGLNQGDVITLYDIQGGMILNTTAGSDIQPLIIEHLPCGSYILTITNKETINHHRMIIHK